MAMSLWPVTLTVTEMMITQDSAVFDPMIGIFSFSHLSFGYDDDDDDEDDEDDYDELRVFDPMIGIFSFSHLIHDDDDDDDDDDGITMMMTMLRMLTERVIRSRNLPPSPE